MPYYEHPPYAPFHAVDLTPQDASALKSFLASVVKEMAAQHAAGTDGHRVARALASAVGAQIDELNLWLGNDWPDTLRERMRAWNYVIFSVWPWEGTDSFDAQRWRLVQHIDADDELSSLRHRVRLLEADLEKECAAVDGS